MRVPVSLQALRARLLPEPKPSPTHVGVYFLIRLGEVVYVGETTDLEQRAGAHRIKRRNGRRKIRFDRLVWFPVPRARLRSIEGALIRSLRPKYNRSAPRTHEHDASILAELGLLAEGAA